jgi:tetratricopeptide (TPR) repeat protein
VRASAPQAASRVLGAALLACAALAAAPVRADGYEDALAKARSLEQGGDLPAAADVLAAACADYPEDFPLQLETAWAEFRAGRSEAASGHYRAALALSEESQPARLGLAWSLLKLGRCGEAGPLFEGVLARAPGHAGAAEGLAGCKEASAVRLFPSVVATGQRYRGSPSRDWGSAITPSLKALLGDVLLGAAYRFGTVPPPGQLLPGSPQHEFYLEAGVLGAAPDALTGRLAWSLHYALIDDETHFSGVSHHVGLTARYPPWAGAALDLSGSFYGDAKVVRAEPSLRLPLGDSLSLRPSLAAQFAATSAYGQGLLGNAALTLSYDPPGWGLFGGGKYGEEFRPVWFARDLVMNSSDRVSFGAWAGGHLDLGRFTLTLAYEWSRLRNADGATVPSRDVHFLTFGLAAGL